MQFLTRLCLIDHKKKRKTVKCKTTTCPFTPYRRPQLHMYFFSLNTSFLDPYSSLSRSPSCSFVQLWWSFFSFVHPLNVSFLAGKHNLLSAYNFMTLCLALAPQQKRNEAEMACHFHTLPSEPFMFGTPDLDQGVDWPIGILSIPWQAAFQELIIRQAVIYML